MVGVRGRARVGGGPAVVVEESSVGPSPERAFDVLAQEEAPPAEDQPILRDVDSPSSAS